MIRIDGAYGEGGGQILRSSLSLSMVTGKPFRIENIRAGRERPGMLRQHLTAVLAAAEVCDAAIEGAALGSAELTFAPGQVKPGRYRFAVGTAGSATLVLQTVLPPLMIAAEPSNLTLEGGTHNMAAPPFEYMERSFLPLIARMGPKVEVRLHRYGFYPAGGGCIEAAIEPAQRLAPLELGPRGEITSRRITGVVANLPRHIAQREVKAAADRLNWTDDSFRVECTGNSSGPGNILMVEVGTADVTEIFFAFGQLQVPAEKVGSAAAVEARDYIASGAAVGEHLADQLLLSLAMAGGGSFSAQKLNLHARTNMKVIRQFLPVSFAVVEEGTMHLVSINA